MDIGSLCKHNVVTKAAPMIDCIETTGLAMTVLPRIAVMLALAWVMLSPCALAQPRPEPAQPPSFAAALQRGLPAALGVYGICKRDGMPFDETPLRAVGPAQPSDDDDLEGRELLRARVGAGFMIDAGGLAVTAAHVVADCERIVVRLPDQRIVLAEKVADDPDTDIALIRLPVRPASAPVFGSAATLRPGDWVLAVGDPYGLNRSVTAGIVGGMDRHFADDRELLFLQTDIGLNPGNSGGPLLDTGGTIVGMNMRSVVGAYGTHGVSLSIPIEIVLQIARELNGGTIRRPRLGAYFDDLSPPVAYLSGRAYASGAVITAVRNGGLAERIGLKPGDIVVGMNGRAIGLSADLTRALLAWREAKGTRFVVFRAGAYRELRLD